MIKVLLILPQKKAKIDGFLKKFKVSFDVKLSIFPFSVLEDSVNHLLLTNLIVDLRVVSRPAGSLINNYSGLLLIKNYLIIRKNIYHNHCCFFNTSIGRFIFIYEMNLGHVHSTAEHSAEDFVIFGEFSVPLFKGGTSKV